MIRMLTLLAVVLPAAALAQDPNLARNREKRAGAILLAAVT
jgi:hypothetical protein